MMSEAIIGALSGGTLRIAPELLRYMNARDERRHERAMQDAEIKRAIKMAGTPEQSIAPVFGSDAVDAMRENHLDAQIIRAGKRFPFVDVISALVRPSVTWTLLALYVTVRLVDLASGKLAYGMDDLQLLSTILSYWFVSRSIEKR
jgi:hypothetical protein